MKVSIITVSYNSGKTIEDTILSVLSQSHKNIEYIIIDGASKDNTLQICEKYKSAISVLKSEKDGGIYDAMNKGIALATGDIIGILNSDDIYANADIIQNVVREFSSHPIQALYGDLVYVDAENLTKIKRYWKSGPFRPKKFKWGWMPPHPTVFLKKELYQQYGLFNVQFRSAADYELMLRFFYKYDIHPHYLPKVMVKMRTGGESNASVHNRIHANKEDQKAWTVNELKPYILTLYFKPLRKIPQFIFKTPKS